MSLIDKTYFQKGLCSIPNLNQDYILDDLNSSISLYEDEYFESVLGYGLYKDFISGIEESEVDAKWVNLRDGAEFEFNNVTYKWKGFVRSSKISPIAYYVMFNHIRDNNDMFTGIGTAKADSENSTIVSPVERMVNIYNKMVDDNRILKMFLMSNESDYSNYVLFNDPCSNVLTKKINIYGI